MNYSISPFTLGPVIPPDQMCGRDEVLHALMARTARLGSATLTGEPHIGKSSVLKYVQSHLFTQYLPKEYRWAVVLRSGFDVGAEVSGQKFWKGILSEALKSWGPADTQKQVRAAIDRIQPDLDGVSDVLQIVRQHNLRLILLLDEIEKLLEKPKLTDHFWGSLRSQATTSQVFCFVLASRETQNELSMRVATTGSPVFNIAPTILLKGFSERGLQEWLGGLEKIDCLTPKDRRVLVRLAGYHPFLLQGIAEALWMRRQEGLPMGEYAEVVETALQTLDEHFKDTWKYMERQPGAQALAALLTLQSLHRGSHDLGDLKLLEKELWREKKLLENTGLFTLEMDRPQMTSALFAIWVSRYQLAKSLGELRAWLADNEKRLELMNAETARKVGVTVTTIYREIKDVIVQAGMLYLKNRLDGNTP